VARWAAAHPAAQIITTDDVFTEFLNALSGTGLAGRAYAAATVRDVRADVNAVVLP
jgi:hypothetical protein